MKLLGLKLRSLLRRTPVDKPREAPDRMADTRSAGGQLAAPAAKPAPPAPAVAAQAAPHTPWGVVAPMPQGPSNAPFPGAAAEREARLMLDARRFEIQELDGATNVMWMREKLEERHPGLIAQCVAPRRTPAQFTPAEAATFKRAGFAVLSREHLEPARVLGHVLDAKELLRAPAARTFASGRTSLVIQSRQDTRGKPQGRHLWEDLAHLARDSWAQVQGAMGWRISEELHWVDWVDWVDWRELHELPRQPGSNLLRLFHYPVGTQQHLAEHVDNGLLTIVAGTGPGLEVYDPERGWIDVGKESHPGDVVVMVGATLQYVSNGALPACRHRVVAAPQDRISAVFHLRARPDAIFSSAHLTTPHTGPFPVPFQHTMQDFTLKHLAGRGNVNEEQDIVTTDPCAEGAEMGA